MHSAFPGGYFPDRRKEVTTCRTRICGPTAPTLIEIDEIDLDGFDVEARDGSIGEVDEATNDVGRQYIVVDTGPWIFGRKVVIPASFIETVDTDNRKVVLDLTKDQIKNSPEYDPDRFDDKYRNDLSTYYASSV